MASFLRTVPIHSCYRCCCCYAVVPDVVVAAAVAAATIVTVRYCRRRVVVQVASIDFTISMAAFKVDVVSYCWE